MNNNIQLLQGNCLELMKNIPDKSVNLILCDLPYGQTARNKWDTVIPFEPLWEQYKRILTHNGAAILFANGMFTADLMHSNKKMWRYNLIWEKTTPTGFLNAKKMPLRSHEDICVFYNKLPTYTPQKTTGHMRKVSKAEHKVNCINSTDYGAHGLTTYDSTERYPKSILKYEYKEADMQVLDTVLTFATDKQKSALHPTQKPVALLEYLIKTYSNENDLVLDNCMGSGSTGVAAKSLARRFIGIELEENYYNIAKNRILNTEGENAPCQ